MAKSAPKKIILSTIDLGAHSARMLIAEIDRETKKIDPLEDLEVLIPLGSDVFRRGRISNETINLLCEVFRNFRTKMLEYAVSESKAIATSAVREAANSEILIERIKHATGIELQIFEGADEARLDYLGVIHDVPEKYAFRKKSTLIADIGTGACQVSSYESDRLSFTETIRVGTMRVLELLPDTVSTGGLMQYLTPVVNKSFSELEHIASSLTSEYIVAMGASVRVLLNFFQTGKKSSKEALSIDKKAFEEMYAMVSSLSIEELSERYGIASDLAETVIPCCVILDNLFRLTGATLMLVPMTSMKYALMHDFINEKLSGKDFFEPQIYEMVKTAAVKYRCCNDYTLRTVMFAEKLFEKLKPLHGFGKRELLLLKIAAYLHKSGLFINNQAYHKHSYYIILNTEIPGLSIRERKITALVGRYHRKSCPKANHPEFMAVPLEDRMTVCKLSALLRIACALALHWNSPDKLQLKVEPELVTIRTKDDSAFSDTALSGVDLDYFRDVYAIPIRMK